jgi:hypothetical protein
VIWYALFNLDEFEALNLTSKEVTLFFEGQGEETVLITKGNLISVLFRGVMLSLNLNDKNPFVFEDHSIYIDSNDDVWLGLNEN